MAIIIFLHLVYFPQKSSESAPCKRKRCQVDLDDDMDFQSSSQSTYKTPDVQYTGRQLKMHFRVEETRKLQWFKGQILNYDPTSGQYGVFFPYDNQTIYIHPNDKDVKFLD